MLVAPALLRSGLPSRSTRVHRWVAQAREALARVRTGLAVFRSPRLGAEAVTMQLGAWALQWVACYVLLVALGLDTRPTSAPPPPSCSRSTSPRCCR